MHKSLILLLALSLTASAETPLLSAEDIDCRKLPSGPIQNNCFQEQLEARTEKAEYSGISTMTKADEEKVNIVISKYQTLTSQLKKTDDVRRKNIEKEMDDLLKSNPNVAKVITNKMAYETAYYISIAGMIKKDNQLHCNEYSRQDTHHYTVHISDAAAFFVRNDSGNHLTLQFSRDGHDELPESYLANTLANTIGAKLSTGQIIPLSYTPKTFRTQSATETKRSDIRLQGDKTYRADFTAGTVGIITDLVCLVNK